MAKPLKIAINGFGRIGRKIARLALANDNIEIVAINNLSPLDQMVHLFKYDSVHGKLPVDVKLDGEYLVAGNKRMKLFAQKDPSALPWGQLGVDLVHECTGVFRDKEKCSLHLKGGAKRVIISAPGKDPDATFCIGVNHKSYDPAKHTIVSNASCTTNCLAPLVKVLDDKFGVNRGTMLTVHSYTNDQQLLDLGHDDMRRARAAAVSQIPTTTGAAKAVGLVLPHLKGRIDGLSIRVPTPNVSMVDFTAELKKTTTKEEINSAFKAAASGELKGILGVSEEELVSIDFNGNTSSSTIDAQLTSVLDGNFIKVISWYDNESGFSQRMIDLSLYMASVGI